MLWSVALERELTAATIQLYMNYEGMDNWIPFQKCAAMRPYMYCTRSLLIHVRLFRV